MSPYNNSIQLRLQQHAHKEHKRAMKRRRQNHKRRRLNQPPPQKIELVYSKQESKTCIRHLEYDVDEGTERWVYFDARYIDPNLRFDKGTETWVHYSTPGLLRNVIQLHFDESTMKRVPAQPHVDVIII